MDSLDTFPRLARGGRRMLRHADSGLILQPDEDRRCGICHTKGFFWPVSLSGARRPPDGATAHSGSRLAVLRALRGARFRCRRCHGVRYSSQTETRAGRATRAMFKIIKKLEPTAEINELQSKTKGMHWRTYARIVDRYEAYGIQCDSGESR